MVIFDSKGIKPMLISEQVEPYDNQDSIFEIGRPQFYWL